MDHYVCKGECGAVSESPEVCMDQTCSHRGQSFEMCSCEDGMHTESQNVEASEGEE